MGNVGLEDGIDGKEGGGEERDGLRYSSKLQNPAFVSRDCILHWVCVKKILGCVVSSKEP